jgi:hypothetical protein
VASLTTVLHSDGDEAYEWPQLYQQDLDFTTTYHLLGIGTTIIDFHIQDRLLCHMGHLCVPKRECAKMIWEAHYSQVAGHFGVEKIVVILQKHFYWAKLRQDVSKYIRSFTACSISKPAIKKKGLCVRKTGPWSNKIKQTQKQNKEYTQYNRDTDLCGSPSVGYVHQRNFQVLPLLLSNI